MAYSYQQVVSDGTLTSVLVTFKYHARSEISMAFSDALARTWAWVGTSTNQIVFDAPVPAGVTVTVLRRTSVAGMRHTFASGAKFSAPNVDSDMVQLLSAIQELREAPDSGHHDTSLDTLLAPNGASMVGYGNRTVADRLNDTANLRDYGARADGTTDCWGAIVLAINAGYTVLSMVRGAGESGVVYLSQFDTALLGGKVFDFAADTTVSTPWNEVVSHTNSSELRHTRDTRYYFRGLANYYTVSALGGELRSTATKVSQRLTSDDALRGFPIAVDASQVVPRKVEWNIGDVWGVDTFAAASGSTVSLTHSGDSMLHFGMIKCKPGDEFSCSFGAAGGGIPLIAAVVRHTNGHAGVWSQADYAATTATFFNKITGSAGTSNPLAFLGAGTHASYSGLGAVWVVRIDSWKSATILLNGYAVARFTTTGYIFECGFGMYPTAAAQTVVVRDIVRMRGAKATGGNLMSVRVYGDSKTAPRYDDWPSYLKDALEFSVGGTRCWRVTNRAVGGHSAAQQRALMATDNLADSNVVVIDVGTNDIQGGVPVATYIAEVTEMIAQAKAAGCTVVLGEPSLWYTQGQVGAQGQAALNYDKGAPYRSALLLLAAQQGCRVVPHTRYDGPVLANYVVTGLGTDLTSAGDPVVYDNIHPTTDTNRRRAETYARTIAASVAGSESGLYIQLHYVGTPQNGWAATTQPPQATVSADGQVQLYGVLDIAAGPRADGTVIFKLPQHLAPLATLRVPCVSQANADNVFINLDSDGTMTLYSCATSNWIDISGVSYCIETREAV